MSVITTDCNGYEYRQIKEHIEVYKNNEFVVSADNMTEARHEVFMLENPCYGCDCYDSDSEGCSMPSVDKSYACPLVNRKDDTKYDGWIHTI